MSSTSVSSTSTRSPASACSSWPTSSRSTFGRSFVSRPPAPWPTRSMRSAGSGPYSLAWRGDEQRARRRQQLALAGAVDGHARHEPRRGRRRHREGPVRHRHRAGADVERRGHEALGLEPGEREDAAHDVDDRVDRPDLVEVDLLGRRAVDRGLGLGQPPEERGDALLEGGVERRAVEQRQDVVEVPVRMARRLGDHVHLGGGEAAARDARGLDADSPRAAASASSSRSRSSGRPRSTTAPSSMSPEAPLAQSK